VNAARDQFVRQLCSDDDATVTREISSEIRAGEGGVAVR
jgi:hypothetical protein